MAQKQNNSDQRLLLELETLRADRDRLNQYFQLAGVLFVVLDREGRVELINREGCRILGYEEQEVVGQDWFQNFLPKRLVSEVRAVFRKIISGKLELVEYFENPIRRRDGSERLIAWHNGEIRDTRRQLVSVISSGTDITDQRTTEQELRDREALLRHAQHLASLGTFRYNPVSGEMMWSEELFRIYGRDPSLGPPMGEEHQTLVLPEDHNKVRVAQAHARNGGKPVIVEYRIRRPDGAERTMRAVLDWERDKNGEPVTGYGAIQDVSELHRAEEQLRFSLHEKEILLQEIHHRVKNNLQVIQSLINLQGTQIDHPGTQAALRDTADRVRSMAMVHEQIYQSKNFSSLDTSIYIRNLLGQLYQSYSITPDIRLDTALDPVVLSINQAIPCGLILNELVTNAFKYAFPDGRQGTIDVRLARRKDNKVRLAVGDNGVGLPPDFDLEKSDSLGYTLVRLLATQLDGTLEVSSRGGTRIEIVFRVEGTLP